MRLCRAGREQPMEKVWGCSGGQQQSCQLRNLSLRMHFQVTPYLAWLWAAGTRVILLFSFPTQPCIRSSNHTPVWAGSACWSVRNLTHLLPWQILCMFKGLSWSSPVAEQSPGLVQGKHQGHFAGRGEWRDVCRLDRFKWNMTHQITHSVVTGFKITALFMSVGFGIAQSTDWAGS